jgi:hypothetical protein
MIERLRGCADGRSRSLFVTGIAAVALYVIAALATAAAHRPVRPLFEGIGPPPPYEWVNPPSRFASGNVKPQKVSVPIAMRDGATITASVATSEGQFLANLGVGAIAGQGADNVVTATVTPLDPATLAPPPPGLAADGNAYRLDLVYGPSGQPVPSLAKPGNVVIVVPSHATALLFSPDGKTWQTVDSQTVAGTSTIGASLQQPGYFLPVAPPDQVLPGGPQKSGSSTGTIIVVVLVTVALAAALVLAPILLRRRRGGGGGPGKGAGRGGRPPGRRPNGTAPLEPGGRGRGPTPRAAPPSSSKRKGNKRR